MKSNGKHIELLDHLRGVAILAVLVFHTLGMAFGYDALPWKGWFRDFSGHTAFVYFLPVGMIAQAGVAIFFVVSGFCIHLSFQTQGRQWRGFFIRRFFRIYPAYILALFFSFLLLTINPGLDFASREFWVQLLSHGLLVHNFNPATVGGINAALWSLAVEAQLYLIYPLLLVLVGRMGWGRAMGMLAACELLIRGFDGGVQTLDAAGTAAGQVSWLLANSPFGYWFSWALGAFIADAWLKKQPLPFAHASPLRWLVLALGVHFARPLCGFQFLLFAVTTAAVTGRCLSGSRPPVKAPAFSLALLQRIGLWSYSLYLLHQPLLHVYSHLIVWAVPVGHRPAPAAFVLVMLTWLIIIPLSALWYRLVEMPGIAFGRKICQTQNSDAAATSVVVAPTAAGRGSKAGYGLMVAALAMGLAASLLVSYQFSLRAAVRRSHEAWALATNPEASKRNGALAVKLAEDACLQTQYRQSALIGILAAAYAEAGRFDEAVGAAQMAGAMATRSGDETSAQTYREMLKLFVQHQPYREPAAGGAN